MLHKNHIGGEWINSPDLTLNINPSDTNDVVSEYSRAEAVPVITTLCVSVSLPTHQAIKQCGRLNGNRLGEHDEIDQANRTATVLHVDNSRQIPNKQIVIGSGPLIPLR